MKKFTLLAAIIAFAVSPASAQFDGSSNKGKPVIGQADVPETARATFIKENPDKEATWKMEGKNYKAEYVDESNVAHARVYEPGGTMLWRDDEMSSYPTPISDYYTKTYPGEGYMIWSRIDKTGVTTYYAYHNSETIWFDKDGKCMNPKKSKVRPNDGIKMK